MYPSRYLLAAVTMAAFLPLHAQNIGGAIGGNAVDPSGAVISGAEIAVVNSETEARRVTLTDARGGFSFVALSPGTYKLTASAAGFQRLEIDGIHVQVAQTVRIDAHLSLSKDVTEVTIHASAAVVEGETSSVGQVITQKQIENLPLNGQKFMQLAVLGSGVVPAYQNRSSTANNGTGRSDMGVHISGGRTDANSYLIDGIETRSAQLGPPSILLSPAAIQEFRVQKNMFEARYGQGSGIVSMVTRSGSNGLHGTLYEFLRNERFDSANYFDNALGQPKAPFRQNQFGGTVGGPIRPNKLFYFFNYEGLRSRKSSTLGAIVPTAAQLSGNLAGLTSTKRDPATGQPAILDPSTGQPFPGNRIPVQELSSVISKFIKYIPSPNANIGGQNLVLTRSRSNDDNQLTGRLDANLRPSDTISGRYIWYDSDLFQPGIAPLYGTILPFRGQTVSMQETHLFSPRLLNVFRAGYNRSIALTGWERTPNSIATELGLKNLNQGPLEFGLPTFVVAGYANLGAPLFAGGNIDNIYQLSDELNWNRGRHNLSFGTDLRQTQFQLQAGASPTGFFTFDGRYSGSSVADFLLGTIAAATTQPGISVTNSRSTAYNFFVQDDFKVTSKLTLNLGLRYEYEQPFYEINGKEGYFDIGQQKLITRVPATYSTLQLPSSKITYDPSFRKGIYEPDFNNWAPRVGFAYRVSDNMAVRGGYGVFYSKTQANELNGKLNNPPVVLSISLTGALNTPNLLIDRDAFPPVSQVQLGTLSPYSINPKDRTPYFQQWNLVVQRRLGGSILAEAGYVGSHGLHLADRVNINQAVPPANPTNPTPLASRRPFPDWGDILSFNYGEQSSYNALQTRLEKRFSGGLSFMAGYTWAHSIDTSSRGAGAASWHQDVRNLHADRGSSDFDVRHHFVLSYTYSLPIGKGRRWFGSAGGGWDRLVGGWGVNGITTLLTGNYETVRVVGDRANTGGAPYQRGNISAGCADNGNLPRSDRNIERYFNADCFSVTPLGTFGNSGRNILQTPGLNNWDIGVVKNTPLTERMRLEFRTEFFNAWNHAQFGVPQLSVQSPLFGKIRSARDPRLIQFAMKLLW
jgi:outer membrane receptor protein involved in Fe transport